MFSIFYRLDRYIDAIYFEVPETSYVEHSHLRNWCGQPSYGAVGICASFLSLEIINITKKDLYTYYVCAGISAKTFILLCIINFMSLMIVLFQAVLQSRLSNANTRVMWYNVFEDGFQTLQK